MSTVEQVESLISKAGDLAETRIELFKLKMVDRFSQAVSSVLSKIVTVVLISLALIICSLGAAFWIGSEMKNLYYGFFIVGGFYVLLGIIVYIFRHALIKKPISTIIIDRIIK